MQAMSRISPARNPGRSRRRATVSACQAAAVCGTALPLESASRTKVSPEASRLMPVSRPMVQADEFGSSRPIRTHRGDRQHAAEQHPGPTPVRLKANGHHNFQIAFGDEQRGDQNCQRQDACLGKNAR